MLVFVCLSIFSVASVGELVDDEVTHTKDSFEKIKENLESKKAVMVDVREKSEWNAGHLKGAILLPYSTKLRFASPKKKLKELPDSFIIFATTSQFTETISEGLRGIKGKNSERIPTNITTIKHFKTSSTEQDFLSYGSSSKNLYLLLLEDL